MLQHMMMFHVIMDSHRIMQQMHNQAMHTGQMKYPDFRAKYKNPSPVILEDIPYKESERLILARENYVHIPLPETRRKGNGNILQLNRSYFIGKKVRYIFASCGILLAFTFLMFLFGYLTSL